jgi:hypothetical protein
MSKTIAEMPKPFRKIMHERFKTKNNRRAFKSDNDYKPFVFGSYRKDPMPVEIQHCIIQRYKLDDSYKKRPDTVKWFEWHVEEWLEDKNIHPTIVRHILPCDGKSLKKYHEMLITLPDFFFNCLVSSNNLSDKEIIDEKEYHRLEYELKKLF